MARLHIFLEWLPSEQIVCSIILGSHAIVRVTTNRIITIMQRGIWVQGDIDMAHVETAWLAMHQLDHLIARRIAL